jgi:acetyl-CoA carboxylase biotin carboxyl carrier protein
MSTSDQNQSPPHGDERGTGAAATPQAESSGASERGPRHGRRRRGRPEPGRPSAQPRRTESALNMDELRELTDLFTAHGLTDFEFENADIRIRLSRSPAPLATAAPIAVVPAAVGPLAAMQTASEAGAQAAGGATQAVPAQASASEGATPSAGAATAEESPEEELHLITSPIVGTFYRSPAPTAEPFIKVGSHVEPDAVVCIIEAMKLMNEVVAETTGTVAKIYVENGQPVEYGQPLFGVKK